MEKKGGGCKWIAVRQWEVISLTQTKKVFGNKRSKKLHLNAAHSRAHSAALQLFIREHILAFAFPARL